MIIEPEEVRLLRRVENQVIEKLLGHAFEEVLFSRVMPIDQWLEVVNVLGTISTELQAEVVHVPNLGARPQVLCHWQCEPYYQALGKSNIKLPSRVFDRSGWSYRNESRTDFLRPYEFQRLEAVWRGPRDEVGILLEQLLDDCTDVLTREGISANRVIQDQEIQDSKQRKVVDLVIRAKDGSSIEVAGGHLHGNVFIRHFLPNAPEGTETACLGISLTRIARLLLMKL